MRTTTSLDTGIANSEYDEAGNVVSRVDAKGQTTLYKYDELNRVKLITYHDSTTAQFLYDQTTNAIGQLSKIIDVSGSTEFGYDGLGRMISDTRMIGGASYVTAYRYDEAGRLAGIDYPTGRVINYVYDTVGRITGINTEVAGVLTPLVKAVDYQPFGPVTKVTFGNDRSQTKTYDLDGRMDSYTLSNQTMKIGYDAASRIKSIADTVNLPARTDYDYDVMDRLTSVQTPTSAQTYEYDAVGNRKMKVNNSAVTSYGYAGPGNRLTKVGTQDIVSDQNGSITNKGNASFTYDVRGRMVSATTSIGVVTYTINTLGQRVRKVTPAATTVFHYDSAGKLIAESTKTGTVTKTTEYVYLGDTPVAVLK